MAAEWTQIPEKFSLGLPFYPEHWPRDRWAGYARQMRELGISYVRMGEFAWSRMEPREGDYQWDWLEDAIAVMSAEGMQIVLCTPTATPPAWLVRKHPEILPVGKDGHVRNFGSRKHYDHASPIYREHSRKITREVSRVFGKHPAVVGWQTDNEWGCHSTTRSYGPASAAAFRIWLRQKYAGSLDDLNYAWGNVFWSQEYTDWSQIDPPNLTVCEPNPSHVLDFYRFASDMVHDFQKEQIEILRELSPGRWITHNYMQEFFEFDHYRNAELLDFASFDSYPSGALERSSLTEDEKLKYVRTGHPDLISLNHDLYRGIKPGRSFWVMEQGAGQVNWAPSNALPAKGAVQLWTAQAYGHGASCVAYFRWRAATVAQELMHSGLLRHDETLDRGGQEVAGLELPGRPVTDHQVEVVVLHDYESVWAYDEQPHSEGARYNRQLFLFYRTLRELGIDVDIRNPEQDLSGYKVIVSPAIQLMSADRAEQLMQYNDASFVFGPRTAYRKPSGRVHEDGQPGPLLPLVGCKLLNFDGLRPGLTVKAGGHVVETWAEAYRLVGGEAVITYDDGPLQGKAAVVRHGRTYSVGAWSRPLLTEVLTKALQEAGIEVQPMPEGVRRVRRGNAAIWLNFNQQDATLPDGSTMGPVSFQYRMG